MAPIDSESSFRSPVSASRSSYVDIIWCAAPRASNGLNRSPAACMSITSLKISKFIVISPLQRPPPDHRDRLPLSQDPLLQFAESLCGSGQYVHTEKQTDWQSPAMGLP